MRDNCARNQQRTAIGKKNEVKDGGEDDAKLSQRPGRYPQSFSFKENRIIAAEENTHLPAAEPKERHSDWRSLSPIISLATDQE